MKAPIYDKTGKEVKKIDISDAIFGLDWNADLVHQVVVSMDSNARATIAHVKDRSEVRGGGRKPWKQKGTGRARHGSRRSPIWSGGGITHGPRNEKDYSKKVNKKMKTKALMTVLSQKMRDGEIIFVEGFDMSEPKTKEARSILSGLAKVDGFDGLMTKRKNAAYIAVSKKDDATQKSFANFKRLKLDETRNMNPADLLNYKFVVIENPTESLAALESRLASKKEVATNEK